MRNRLKWAGHVERMGAEHLGKRADAEDIGGEGDREYDWMTALRQIWKEQEKNG